MGPPSPSRRPGSAFQPILLLSPRIARIGAIRGRGWERGGGLLPSGESCVSLLSTHFSARSVILANEQGLPPSPWPSPPTQKRVGGEGRNCGNADPGPPSGSCRWLRPGLSSDAPLGLYKEEAASCRFTNVESPDEGFRSKAKAWPPWSAPARRLCQAVSSNARAVAPTESRDG